jgi:PhnB protein
MARLNAYLMFNGNCREAMTFYNESISGELTLQTVGDSPAAGQMPPEMKNRIMHSELKKGNVVFMASDMMDDTKFNPGNVISLCLICESKNEIESLFSALSKGGKVSQPLKEEFFGTFGSFTDKFGISWMLQYGTGPQ